MERWDSEWLAAVQPLGLAGVVLPGAGQRSYRYARYTFHQPVASAGSGQPAAWVSTRDATQFKASVREIALFVAPGSGRFFQPNKRR